MLAAAMFVAGVLLGVFIIRVAVVDRPAHTVTVVRPNYDVNAKLLYCDVAPPPCAFRVPGVPMP